MHFVTSSQNIINMPAYLSGKWLKVYSLAMPTVTRILIERVPMCVVLS